MYQAYWGLRESPFRSGIDLTLFRPTANHDEAFARLQFLVEERRRLGFLFGRSGIGKSLLLEVFARQLQDQGVEVARLNLTGGTSQEFLWSLAAQCGLNPTVASAPFVLWRAIADRLIQLRYEQGRLVVLLDDANTAEPDVLDLVLRLVQVDPHPDSRLTVVLTSSDDRLTQVRPRLVELAELAITLDPWQATDTAAFVEFAMRQAGRATPAFTPAALRRLHELADGIAARVEQLADLCLVAGAGLGLDRIDADTVDDAWQELGLVAWRPMLATASH